MSVEFTVLGRPQPAGSKRAFAIRKGGELTGRVAVTDANPKSKDWQQSVASAAREAVNGAGLLTGPVTLEAGFYFARPKGHYGTGRNSERVKDSAPFYPAVKPDTTKLLRGLEDALTGVLWRDDSQVVVQFAFKQYGEPERVTVFVQEMS